MTKKEAEALKKEIAKLREKVEALEKEPRKWEFHYHPPLFVQPYIPPPPSPWWVGPYVTCGGSTGGIAAGGSGLGPAVSMMNRLEATSCVN